MKEPRLWRYEVDKVWDTDAVKVGDILVDRWHPDRTWRLLNFETMQEAGGWHCKLLGECLGEMLVKARASKAKRRPQSGRGNV